jgi:hypothetical protein
MKKYLFPLCIVLLLYACTPMENPMVVLNGVSIEKESLSIGYGTSYTLLANVSPKRLSGDVTLLWTTSNAAVVEVDQKGVITAKRHGEAIITVTATQDGTSFTASCEVTVVPVVVETDIPDEVFRAYCLEIADSNKDGILSSNETAAVYRISVSGLGITSLEGIQIFPSLITLNCENNQLTHLDVSANTALQTLYCYSNQLTSLDMSANPALQSLYCYSNQLTDLDVSGNPALRILYCANNKLTSLDVSANPALQSLYCYSNQLISIDISKNIALKVFTCQNNQLTALDLNHNFVLEGLACNNNQLSTLDVSKNTALSELYCYNNPNLTALWLKTGQTIANLTKDSQTVIGYK